MRSPKYVECPTSKTEKKGDVGEFSYVINSQLTKICPQVSGRTKGASLVWLRKIKNGFFVLFFRSRFCNNSASVDQLS